MSPLNSSAPRSQLYRLSVKAVLDDRASAWTRGVTFPAAGGQFNP